ncbi:DUF2207 domain-containing protein [Caldilinea sp.]|uniref:DUF2207 domain-containing protein n=1 Tax=Caldilinea sp. TaxID=2293560 RepID=UPI00257D9515|nr:DUF2207 domain-containing protein [Caldilinea sp.]
MLVRYRWIWLLLIAFLFSSLYVASTPSVSAAEKSIIWERFDVDIQVNEDGSFDVAEHQRIRFIGGTFREGYREIPKRNFGYLSNWSVTDDGGNVYAQTTGGELPYTFTVDDLGDRYMIRWFFPPTSQTRTFTLRYRVHEGLRYYAGGEQLWWKAVFGDRQFPVLESRVRVLVPAPATIDEWAAYINSRDARDAVTAERLDNGRTIVFTTLRTLRAGEELEVRVQFTHGVVAGSAPAWQAAADAEAARQEAEQAFRDRWGPVATVILGVLTLVLLLGGPALVYLMWYNYGRDKPVTRIADYLPEPPDDLQPGLAGVLLDESADMQDIVATIVDLARRGVISITEVKESGLFRMGTDFIYRLEKPDAPLAPFEQKLVKAIFGAKKERKLSELKDKFYTAIPAIKTAMYEALVERGYYRSNPESVRTQFGCLGGVAMVAAIGLSFLLMVWLIDLTPAAICPGIGLFAIAISLLIAARFMPRKTDEGAEAAARWKAFKEYLRNLEKYTDVEAQKEIWDRWLPYAIAFGIDKAYIRKFEAVNAPAPGWYIPSPQTSRPGDYGPRPPRPIVVMGGGGVGGGETGSSGGSLGGGLSDASRGMGASLASMSAGLGALLSSTSATFTSRPSSSSGGGGWSGGGGFSGGGSFGGGGGGGGGGGFR